MYIPNTVLADVIHKITYYNPKDSQQLIDRKVINMMKTKRNKKKSANIKAGYQVVIDQLETAYNTKYNG